MTCRLEEGAYCLVPLDLALAVLVARFDRKCVESSLVRSLMAELAGCGEAAQDAACLVGAEPAELGSLIPGDLVVCLDVLQDHLLSLERFEAVHADIARGCVQRAVDRRGQVPVA